MDDHAKCLPATVRAEGVAHLSQPLADFQAGLSFREGELAARDAEEVRR